MSWYGQASGVKECLTSPTANWVVANTTTLATASGGTVNTIGLFRPEYALLTLVITGTAGSSGNVTAKFLVRGDEKQAWPNNTLTAYDVTGALSGTTTMRYVALIDCRGITELKLYSMVNADATHTCTANVEVTFKD